MTNKYNSLYVRNGRFGRCKTHSEGMDGTQANKDASVRPRYPIGIDASWTDARNPKQVELFKANQEDFGGNRPRRNRKAQFRAVIDCFRPFHDESNSMRRNQQ
jgi:hypothetical protein